jgi:hypothetical protein
VAKHRVVAQPTAVEVIRQVHGDHAFQQEGKDLAYGPVPAFQEAVIGTTPSEIGSHILDGVLGPVPLGLAIPHRLDDKSLGVCIAYALLPGAIALPVDVADKVSQDGVGTAGIEKQELRQF